MTRFRLLFLPALLAARMLVGGSGWAAEEAAPAPVKHRFLCVDNDAGRLIHVDQTRPGRDWQIPIPKTSRDLQRLAGERVLASHGDGCGIYALRDGRLLWKVDGYNGIQTARWIEERGELLLGANTAEGCEFYVLERDGEFFKKTGRVLKAPFKGAALRLVRPAPDGRLLFAAAPHRVVEWDPATGKTAWEGELPGKGYMAVRLPGGLTAASTGDAVSVVLLDQDGKTRRTYGGKQFAEKYRLKWFSGFEVLNNGHAIATNWLGHGAQGTGPHLVEFDAENRLVWSWEDHQLARQVTTVLILDDRAGAKNPGGVEP